jgi:hypothetical protein
MATPISGGTAFDFGAAAQAPAVQPQTTTVSTASAKQPTTKPQGDTVKLSEGAQVRLLSSQGDTVSEIVINTALSAQAVNSYLGISQEPKLAAAGNNK